MPGKTNDDWAKEIMEVIGDQAERDWYDNVKPKDIWVSPNEKEKIDDEEHAKHAKKEMQKIIDQFEMQKKQKPGSEIDRLRNEMRDEFADIKKALHTLGIMLDQDQPSNEDLATHPTLREAYRKYKMIEALILGQK